MKGVSAVDPDRGDGGDRACQIEEDAGIGPFLEPRKTRREYGDGSKYLPKTQDGEEVHRVAENGHDAVGIGVILPHLRNTAASDKERYEDSHSPIRNSFSVHSQSIP